jgi:transcriptional regulator with XRE-family HTH domain
MEFEGEQIDWARWVRSLGRQSRCVREFLGLSQEQLARLAGVSQGAVSRLEAGRGMSTPILVVVKIYLALAHGLRALDPAVLRDDVRRLLELGPRVVHETNDGPASASDPELLELVRLYHDLPAERRATLASVVNSAWSSHPSLLSRRATSSR